jgi:hypothetical protein
MSKLPAAIQRIALSCVSSTEVMDVTARVPKADDPPTLERVCPRAAPPRSRLRSAAAQNDPVLTGEFPIAQCGLDPPGWRSSASATAIGSYRLEIAVDSFE